MNNNMTGTTTLNAIYENMGCKGRTEMNGLCVPDSYSGSILKPEYKNPSTLEVVPYVADKHAHLPDYAREMIEMIEEAEYEALNNYLNSKDQWSRNVVIDEEGNEVVTWVHVSEQALDPELEEYKKFLASSSFDVENDKSIPVGWEGETVALQTLFNLHVGDVD